jgi:hypothetical protein
LRSLPYSGEKAFVECKVQDANLDPNRVRVEYQTRDKTWKVLNPLPGSPGLFRIPGPTGPVTPVRATATDRAGNSSTRTLNLTFEGVRAAAVKELPVFPAAEAKPSNKPAPPPTLPTILSPGTEKAPESPRANAQTPEPPRKLVNGTHISLDYQIEQQGPSGISKVEVWITRDGGSSWQHLSDDPDHKSPVELDLPGEGLYGISLVMANGNGLGGVPPVKGDAPDSWVEVDLTRPEAHLVSVRPGSGDDAGSLVVSWTASDKNLGSTPIDLYYATQQNGPWQPIARGVKNDGSYRWSVPREAGSEFLIRLDVADQAGNITRCETPQPVVVDLVRPKARVLNVTVSAPHSAAQ